MEPGGNGFVFYLRINTVLPVNTPVGCAVTVVTNRTTPRRRVAHDRTNELPVAGHS